MIYDVALELNETFIDEVLLIGLPVDLHDLHAIVAPSERGWLSVLLLVPANTALEAAEIAITRTEQLTLKTTVALEVRARMNS